MFKTLILIFIAILSSFAVAGQDPSAASKLPGLKGEVTVRRDARGIPYIDAKTDTDLYFVQGYETARDRLWQMDLMRRLSRGETAELFGANTLDEDKRWRRFGFAAIADKSLPLLSPELRTALDDYARGVNAYIATLDAKTLPSEFQILQYKPKPWLATDTIMIGKILADALSTTWRNDLMRLQIQALSKQKQADLLSIETPYDVVLFGKDAPTAKGALGITSMQLPSEKLLAAATADDALRTASLERVGLYAEGLAASNNWVISGKLTADGKPILANDPHLAATAPGIWHLVELTSPNVHVAGVTFPGVPGVVLGHNDTIAWGATNVGPDVQDLYDETFNDAGEYKTPTGWAKPVIRKEIINVRGNLLKPDTQPVTLDVTETIHGPIILEDGGHRYSLRWTAFDPHNNEFAAFFSLDRAKSWQDFTAALKTYGGAAQNFVYADTKGNIGWYAAGRIPLRKTGDGSLPYSGATTDGDWTGYIPFDELPHLYNPPSGLIVTANQRIVSNTYKYPQIGRDVATPWRARRILDALSAKTKITMDDVRDVQLDVWNKPLSMLSAEIIERGAASPETIDVLKQWDGKMTPDSPGSVLADGIRGCVADHIAGSNAPAPMYVIRERFVDRAIREDLKYWLPDGVASFDDLLKTCDSETRVSLSSEKRLGPDVSTWTWGRTFVSRAPHPLAVVPLIGGQFATPSVPIAGSGQTPNVGSGVSMRFIASPGNWDATRHVIPLGESGVSSSPHFKDQFDLWRTGAPAIFPFSVTAVKAGASETRLYQP